MLKRALVQAAVASFVAVMLAAPADAATYRSTTIARRYHDGLDSRLSAQKLSESLGAAGYATRTYSTGRSAADAWGDGLESQVFGAFGHANSGIFQTDEGPTDADDEILAAGDIGYLSGGNWWFWSDYLPYIDVDDMRLAIFAGCYTSGEHPSLSSFARVATERGVESVVGFEGLVYYPANCVDCLYSGNYFWSRFATYARGGDTVGTALSKARADIVAKEGSAGGWEWWQVGGAARRPADVRVVPAGYGELNSQPFGIDPYDFTDLTTVARDETTVAGREVVDVDTAEGVSYRRAAASGDLLWARAPASTEGDIDFDAHELRAIATDFAHEHVSWFGEAGGRVTETSPSHEPGDALYGFTWRSETDGVPGGRVVELEIDRRTGSVVYFAAHRAPAEDATFAVTRDDAVVAARRSVDGDVVVVSAHRDVWGTPRWTVELERAGESLVPDRVRVEIDGRHGNVLAVSAT